MRATQTVGGILILGIGFWLFSIWTTTVEQGTFLWNSSLTIRALSGVYILSGLSIGIYQFVLNKQLEFRASVGVSIISTISPIIFRTQEIFEHYDAVTTIFDIDYIFALYDSAVFVIPATTALGIALSRSQTTNERVIGIGMLLFPPVTYFLSTLDRPEFWFFTSLVAIVSVLGGFLLGIPLYFMVNRLGE